MGTAESVRALACVRRRAKRFREGCLGDGNAPGFCEELEVRAVIHAGRDRVLVDDASVGLAVRDENVDPDALDPHQQR